MANIQASYGAGFGFPPGVYIQNVVSWPRLFVEALLLKENGCAKMSQVGRWVVEKMKKMKNFIWDFGGSQEARKGPGDTLEPF